MAIKVSCSCGAELQASEEHVGKKIRCPKCQAVMTVPASEATGPPPRPKSRPPEENVTSAESPARSKRSRGDEDDDDDRPVKKKKKAGSNAWIIWLVLGVVVVPICCGGGIFAALLLPAISKVREAASRVQTANNMKQLGLAIHNYHNTFRKVPEADKNGLSWRVAVLPFVENAALYQQFKQDEPWDSPANRQLLERMPKVFEHPGRPAPPGHTYFQAVVGPAAVFSAPPRTLGRVTDGTSNTLMLVEAAEAVPWTKPADFVLAEGAPLAKLGDGRQFLAVYADGSYSRFGGRVPVTDAILRPYLTADRNDQIDPQLDDGR